MSNDTHLSCRTSERARMVSGVTILNVVKVIPAKLADKFFAFAVLESIRPPDSTRTAGSTLAS